MNRYIGPKNKKQECKDYTSKCVIWDGPTIKAPCINVEICRGDNIEVPIYEVYRKLCEVLQSLDIEGLDLQCLTDVAANSYSLADLFTYITDKLCEFQNKLDQYQLNSQDITADLPFCFQYEINGSVITKLEITQYYELIASRICGLFISLNDLDNSWSYQDTADELSVISATIASTCNQGPILVTPTCTNNIVINPGGDPVDIQTAYKWLEQAFCSFRNFVGTASEIQTAISYDCPNLSSTPKLYGVGNMSDYYQWVDTPGTLAQSMNNLWITICDTRNALRDLLDNCCYSGCSNLKVGYVLTLNDPISLTLQLTTNTTFKSETLYTNVGAVVSLGPVAATYTFQDPGAAYVVNALQSKRVRIISGTGVLQDAVILSNTATNITVSTTNTNWINILDATSVYQVYEIYDGTAAEPSWVSTQFTSFTNLVVTLNDGSGDYSVDTGSDIRYWLNPALGAGTVTIPYPTGYDPTSLFKTINISFDYTFDNPLHPGDTNCTTCECCCNVNLTNGIY